MNFGWAEKCVQTSIIKFDSVFEPILSICGSEFAEGALRFE